MGLCYSLGLNGAHDLEEKLGDIRAKWDGEDSNEASGWASLGHEPAHSADDGQEEEYI